MELQPLSVLPPEELLCTAAAASAAAAAADAPPGSGSAPSDSRSGLASGEAPCAPITQLGTPGSRAGRGPNGLLTVVSAAGGVAVIQFEGRQQPGAGGFPGRQAAGGWVGGWGLPRSLPCLGAAGVGGKAERRAVSRPCAHSYPRLVLPRPQADRANPYQPNKSQSAVPGPCAQ